MKEQPPTGKSRTPGALVGVNQDTSECAATVTNAEFPTSPLTLRPKVEMLDAGSDCVSGGNVCVCLSLDFNNQPASNISTLGRRVRGLVGNSAFVTVAAHSDVS